MKAKTEQHFDETYSSKPAQNYERYFVPTIGEPIAKDLIGKAKLRPGERVLDVACGTGIIARLALQRVGDSGTVTGVDINPGMLRVAKEITPDSSIEWHEANAEQMPFRDESFDVVFCQMGLQFMEDRSSALKEMNRVLVPSGRLILNVPGPAGEPFEIFAGAMERHIGPEAKKFVNHIFAMNDTEELKQLIINAGFDQVDVRAKNKILSLPTPKKFFWQYISSTPLAEIIAKADEETKASLEKEVVEKWQNILNEGAFIYEQRILTVSARK